MTVVVVVVVVVEVEEEETEKEDWVRGCAGQAGCPSLVCRPLCYAASRLGPDRNRCLGNHTDR